MIVRLYALTDPKTARPVYVGHTRKSLTQRLKSHLSDAHSRMTQPVNRWLAALADIGEEPGIVELDVVDTPDYDGIERIRRNCVDILRKQGVSLLNN